MFSLNQDAIDIILQEFLVLFSCSNRLAYGCLHHTPDFGKDYPFRRSALHRKADLLCIGKQKIGRGHFSAVNSCYDNNGAEYPKKIQNNVKSYCAAAREEILVHEYLNKSDKPGQEDVCIMLTSFSHSVQSGKHLCIFYFKSFFLIYQMA